MRSNLRVFYNALELLTNNWPTPLVKLESLSKNGYEVWAKLEYYNPFSRSIKDRTVWYMLKKAMEHTELRDVLYEATSGNVGISLACLANIFKFKLKVFIPKHIPRTTELLLRILNTEIVKTNYETINWNMIDMVAEKARKERALNLNQFTNDANYEVHLHYTAKEIDEQLTSVNRKPDVIIAGIGTSGHISALAMYFKSRYGNRVKIIGVQPALDNVIPGLKRIETRPKWLAKVKMDEVVDVTLKDACMECVWIARNEGILVGLSSGATINAFKKVKTTYGQGVYVLIFPDDIYKYVNIIEKTCLNSPQFSL